MLILSTKHYQNKSPYMEVIVRQIRVT